MTTEIGGQSVCFSFCAPEVPGTPFATPGLLVLDSIRVLVMILGMVLIVFTPRLIINAGSAGQRARLFGQSMFALAVIGTEVEHIGDYAHYRLAISCIGLAVMLWGTWRIRFEDPPRTRHEKWTRE